MWYSCCKKQRSARSRLFTVCLQHVAGESREAGAGSEQDFKEFVAACCRGFVGVASWATWIQLENWAGYFAAGLLALKSSVVGVPAQLLELSLSPRSSSCTRRARCLKDPPAGSPQGKAEHSPSGEQTARKDACPEIRGGCSHPRAPNHARGCSPSWQ